MVLGRSSSRDRPHTLLACQDGSPQPQATAPRLRSGSWPSLQHTPGRTGQRSGWPAWVRAPAVHGSSPCGVERGAGMGVSRLPCPPSVLHLGAGLAWVLGPLPAAAGQAAHAIHTHGSGECMGEEAWRMYCVHWKTRKARLARKSRADSRPATGRSWKPVRSARTAGSQGAGGWHRAPQLRPSHAAAHPSGSGTRPPAAGCCLPGSR